MTVPFVDLQAAHDEVRPALDEAYRRVLGSGSFVLGEELEAFEREFAAACGVRHAVGTGNGLDALHLILLACGVGPGDEVVVPAHTFIATWLAVSWTGARPIPAEVDRGTGNLDPERLPIGARTRAIVPVHLYGQPADMDPILEIARDRGLRVIEDAAQAHGARYKGRPAGALGAPGDAAAFSFYPTKNLGALGDGGAVVTDDDDLAERVRLLRSYGSRVKYQHEIRGFNSRLDPLQAAFLRAKLPLLDDWNERRRRVARRYLEGLAGVPGVALPEVPAWADPAWHLFVVRHPRRDALQEHLRAAGIGTLIHYPQPPHLAPAYAEEGWRPGDFPVAEELADTVLSLPMGPHLAPEAQDRVIAAIRSFGACGETR